MVHNIRITFGAQTQPQIDIQQGDYNSRTIQALCYTSSGGAMSFDGQTVSVVYSISGTVSAEYPVQVNGNVLSFTLPGLASASVGTGSMQVRIYGSESLLQSAIIPYVVKASLDPGPAEEDQVPMLVMLVQQAQQAIAECTAATDKANETVADIEQKLADGAFIGPTGPTGPQGYQGIGVTSASLDDQGELVFTVTDPATGGSSTLPPVDIDTSAAINTVEQAAQDGVQKVQDAQASAISAVDQAGKNAGTQAVSEVYSAKDTAIADIATVKSGAESAITAAQQSAVQTVQQSGTTAVGQVQKAQNTATTAIAQAQQNAITSVENEGDAQVQRLQEIVPQPTADNNGMVVAVQSGAYQLENPAGLVLNDCVITSENGWSSMQIVKTLCPPFTASGSVVQCTPVENSPLDVQVEITPTQEGSGDPSPENVRPIVGWDSVNVTRCGKNLFDISTISTNSEIKNNGDSLTVNTSLESVRCATRESLEDICHNIPANVLYNFNANTTSNLKQAYFNSGVLWKFKTSQNLDDPTKKSPIYFYGNSINETGTISNIQLEIGSTATEYEPYRGQTYTVQLGQTVYGGTLDVGTGVGSKTWGHIASYNGESLPGEWISDRDVYSAGTTPTTGAQVAYKLATPEPFQATGAQPILGLSDTNTIYADAGNITVNGASDPIATITALQNRVSALESAQTNM